ncbi:hypothetical protein [Streptomyces sp. TRM68367]|uniref:hypothetical protein n=1 Tax=Streptomyces sp. TRM68367 TaxID=2758415 RepID=UPI0037DCB7F1
MTHSTNLDRDITDTGTLIAAAHQGQARVDEAFPGGSEPTEVVVRADDIDAPEVKTALPAIATHTVTPETPCSP